MTLLLWFVNLTAGLAQTGWPPTVSIQTDSAYFPFDTAHFQVFADSSHRLTFDEVRRSNGFRSGPNYDPDRQTHVYWLRMRVRNDRPTDLGVYYSNITGDYADIYWLDSASQWQHRRAGALLPQSELTEHNGYRSSSRVFFRLKAGQETTIYQRAENVWWHMPPQYFKPQLETEAGLAKAVFRYYFANKGWLIHWYNGVGVGVLLLAFGYNLLVYSSTKERVYLYFGLCLLFFVLDRDRNQTNAQTALFSEYPYWLQFFGNFFFLAFFVCFIQAIRRFVQPQVSLTRLDRLIVYTLNLTIVVYVAQIMLFWWAPQAALWLELVLEILVRVVYSLCIWLTYRQMRRQNSDARFVLIAIMPLAIWWLFTVVDKTFYTYFQVSLSRELPASFEYAENMAFAWMIIFFSAALLNRYNLTRQQVARQAIEREQLEKERSRLIAEQNERLEQQVRERTAELQQSLETLKTTQNQLVQKEKLASLGELTAGIAHEIQNPLNFVNNFSEVSVELVNELEEEREKGNNRDESLEVELLGDIKQNLQKINQHGKRAGAIVRGMLEHSRASTGEPTPTDLNALADEYLRLAYHGLRAKDKTFSCQFFTDLDAALPSVSVVSQDVGRVLLNLYNNAFYAVQERATNTGPGTAYQPTVWVSTRFKSGTIKISVRDNGTGIPDVVKQKIFQPFFTTKPTGEGTGLGLSLSYDIITKRYGGELIVESHEGEGTEFVIKLPV
ncbi:histidine kinase [Spirosoma montaniterrae]|uniref:histidine kinase n=1 Tax=Spirosoma montaniterrae TaxID=1178516 RepID=A0A1P9X4Z2_9BACT|nr:histidine kinase [Spirosoma montaniterrae]